MLGDRKGSVMARRRRVHIDVDPVSLERHDVPFLEPLRRLDRFAPVLRDFEDRRLFHPDPLRAPGVFSHRDARRIVAKSFNSPRLRNDISARVGFAVPEKVVRCVRRKERKEVLHATDFMGRGAGGVTKRRRRDWFSDVDC